MNFLLYLPEDELRHYLYICSIAQKKENEILLRLSSPKE